MLSTPLTPPLPRSADGVSSSSRRSAATSLFGPPSRRPILSVATTAALLGIVASGTTARAQTPPPAAEPSPLQQQPPPGQPQQTSPATPRPGAPATPAVTPAPEATQNVQPLTLTQAISLALRAQPSLYQASANREASSQRLREQQSNYYPSISPNFTYTQTGTRSPTTQVIPIIDPVTGQQTGTRVQTLTRDRTGEAKSGDVALTYRLFDTGSRDLSNRQARESLRASDYALSDTRQSVIANVATAYFTALRNSDLVRVDQAQVARAQNTLDVVQAQVAAGAAARKDVYQAQADLLNAQVTLLQAQNNADLAQAQLRQAIGVIGGGGALPGAVGSVPQRLTLATVPVPADNTPLAATLTTPPSGTAKKSPEPAPTTLSADVPTAIEQLLNVAYQERPDIREAQQNVEVNRTSKRLAEVQASPQVAGDVGAGYVYTPYTGDNRQVTLSATYPLFDGGLTRARVRETQANIESSQAQLETLRQDVAVTVEQAYRTLVQARAALPAAAAAQQAAQVNYDAAIESRREGVGSIVDVITAQTTLVQAQSSYVQAVYDFYSADAVLARAVGQADRIGTNIPTTGATTAPTAPAVPMTPLTPTTPTPAPAP